MKKILQYPFTKDCQWWAPIELITRLLLIIFIMVDIGNLVSECSSISYEYYQEYYVCKYYIFNIYRSVNSAILLFSIYFDQAVK